MNIFKSVRIRYVYIQLLISGFSSGVICDSADPQACGCDFRSVIELMSLFMLIINTKSRLLYICFIVIQKYVKKHKKTRCFRALNYLKLKMYSCT